LPKVDVRCAQAVSPLRGCAGLAALATAKIHCRRPTFNFQTGSKPSGPGPEGPGYSDNFASDGELSNGKVGEKWKAGKRKRGGFAADDTDGKKLPERRGFEIAKHANAAKKDRDSD